MKVFDIYENCELKDQRLTKRQMIAKAEIKFTQFQALYSLKPETQVQLLCKLQNREVSLKQMQSMAEKEKKMSDIRTKFQHLSNCSSWEEGLRSTRFIVLMTLSRTFFALSFRSQPRKHLVSFALKL